MTREKVIIYSSIILDFTHLLIIYKQLVYFRKAYNYLRDILKLIGQCLLGLNDSQSRLYYSRLKVGSDSASQEVERQLRDANDRYRLLAMSPSSKMTTLCGPQVASDLPSHDVAKQQLTTLLVQVALLYPEGVRRVL